MNAKEFNEIIDKIDVDKKTKEGILELIDVKTVSEMKPLLNEFKSEFKEIRSEFKTINSELKAELRAIQEKSDSEFKISNSESKRIEDKIDTKTTMLMWGMGIIMGLIGILITVLVASKFIH